MQHGQPGHQFGHQHGTIRGRTVEVVEGFRLAIRLTHLKSQAEQVRYTQAVARVAFFDEQGLGTVELVIIEYAVLIEEFKGLAIADGSRGADEQLDGLDQCPVLPSIELIHIIRKSSFAIDDADAMSFGPFFYAGRNGPSGMTGTALLEQISPCD